MVVVVGCCWLCVLRVLVVAGVVNWLMYVGCCCWLVLVAAVVFVVGC